MNNLLFTRSLGQAYYRQNAGLFAFLFFIMFIAVGRANGVGLLEYHTSLIIGSLSSPSFLLVVLAAWILYAWKCLRFVENTIQRKEYSFLYQLALLDRLPAFIQLLLTQLFLYLPVWSYLLIMVGVGIRHQLYLSTFIILFFNGAICLASIIRYRYLLQHPGAPLWKIGFKMPALPWKTFYPAFLIRYIWVARPALFFVTKLFSTGILYLLIVNTLDAEQDHRMIFLFYSFGVLGHGALLFRTREMERKTLLFYRSLPHSLFTRLLQYALFNLLLFLPELICIASLTPVKLHYADALLYGGFGYSILLLINSLLLLSFPRIMNYLKVIGLIYFFIFLGVLTGWLSLLTLLFLMVASWLFLTRYYKQETL